MDQRSEKYYYYKRNGIKIEEFEHVHIVQTLTSGCGKWIKSY